MIVVFKKKTKLTATLLSNSSLFALHVIKLPEGKHEMKQKENMRNLRDKSLCYNNTAKEIYSIKIFKFLLFYHKYFCSNLISQNDTNIKYLVNINKFNIYLICFAKSYQ